MAGINGNFNFGGRVGNNPQIAKTEEVKSECEGENEAKLPTKEIPVKTRIITFNKDGKCLSIKRINDGMNVDIYVDPNGVTFKDGDSNESRRYDKDGNEITP